VLILSEKVLNPLMCICRMVNLTRREWMMLDISGGFVVAEPEKTSKLRLLGVVAVSLV